jgi:hypothetical protein
MDNDMLILRFYSLLGRLGVEIGEYLRTERFRLDMPGFLLTDRYG